MRPTWPLVIAAGAVALVGGVALVWPPASATAATLLVALLLAAAVDALRLRRQPAPTVTRDVPEVWAVGRVHPLVLRVAAAGPTRVRVDDRAPESATLVGLPVWVDLPAEGRAEIRAEVRPTERGRHAVGPVHLLQASPWRLWESARALDAVDTVRVHPDFRRMAGLMRLGAEGRVQRLGLHLQRRRGEGAEFHQLREYRPEDQLRRVDWKATARLRRPVSREYREERDQHVILLLDCGRSMHARDGDLSHFDEVLEALLLLAAVAVRQGDAVGLLTFSGPDVWVPPRRGPAVVPALLDAVFDLRSSTAPSDYAEAARRLSLRQRRRALVVALTNVREEATDDLVAHLGPLRGQHKLLVGSLREPALDAAVEGAVADLSDALRVGAAAAYLESRRDAHAAVSGHGIPVLDCRPEELGPTLVGRYLELKAAGA